MKRSETATVPPHPCEAGLRPHHPNCARERCLPCARHHQRYYSKTFLIRHPEESESHKRWRKTHPKRLNGCQTCGRPRKKRLWYCARCREVWRMATTKSKWRRENNAKRERNLALGIARPNRWKVPDTEIRRREAA